MKTWKNNTKMEKNEKNEQRNEQQRTKHMEKGKNRKQK